MNNTQTLEQLQDFVNQLREQSQGKVIECVYLSYTKNKFEARAFNDTEIILEIEK